MKKYEWTRSKNGPRMIEIETDNQYKTGWDKQPGFMTTLIKSYDVLVFCPWNLLTDDQRIGIYNHRVKYTTQKSCRKSQIPGNDDIYIFHECRGTFEIKYSDEYGEFTLTLITGIGNRYTLISNPAGLSNTKAIAWLKRYTQYLIDEPDELNVMLCRQIPIAPYVNIPQFLPGVCLA